MAKKIKNPLVKRIPRELLGEWKKYVVVSLFLILTIGFVSGMYIANDSMLTSASEGKTEYKLEFGHFETDKKLSDEIITAIESGEMADVRQYYLDKAKTELDEKFPEEFTGEFNKEFEAEFTEAFDSEFENTVKQQLLAQGLDEATAAAMLPEAIEQAKSSGDYKAAYDEAYNSAYKSAYDKAYTEAYDTAWSEIEAEVLDKYSEAEELYELNSPDFEPVPIKVYESFYKNAEEENGNELLSDGTIRVFAENEEINLACLMEGSFPQNEKEIAIDRMHADNAGIATGDKITVGGEEFTVSGLLAYVNYSTLYEKNTDFMFDALRFNVGMVTAEGFDRINKPVQYCYSWDYVNVPADETREKYLSDNLMKSLVTQIVCADAELLDFLPRYANQAINFATGDMGSDKTMGGMILDVLTVIIAFIFAVTISNTIVKESSVIGTLRASGYTRGELVLHYLSMPVIVTLISALIGNVLGYTLFKNIVVGMYYNSYSLPLYRTIWNPEAFIKTTLLPVALMLIINLFIIAKMMRHTPLQFLRRDLKKNKRKKAIRLPKWGFMHRFRIRVILQNIPNYLILFFGVLFVAVMLSLAVGMPDTLDYYKENARTNKLANYTYILKAHETKDGVLIETENENAERFALHSLVLRNKAIEEDISVYGVYEDSKYIDIPGLDGLENGQVYISQSFSEKYRLKIGDKFTIEEKYENNSHEFSVAGLYDKTLNISVFMPVGNFRQEFEMEKDEFSGFLSDQPLTDLDQENIASIITEQDITKACDQLDHSMGNYMLYFQVLCILLSAVLIYLLTKIIIEKNKTAISMTKILGYENREIASLYLLSTTIVLVISDIISTILGSLIISAVWGEMMAGYSGWFKFNIQPLGYLKIFSFIFIGYLIVMLLDFRRIKKIPMDEALKNIE